MLVRRLLERGSGLRLVATQMLGRKERHPPLER